MVKDIEAQKADRDKGVSSPRRRLYSARQILFPIRRQKKSTPLRDTRTNSVSKIDLHGYNTQRDGRDLAVSIYHKTAIGLFFGLPTSYLNHWPGILMFFAHLETQFSHFFGQSYNDINRLLGLPVPEDRMIGWEWCFAIVKVFKELQSNERHIQDGSVGNVFDRLLQDRKLSASALGAKETEDTYRAIFSSICWMSMTLKPVPVAESQTLSSPAVKVSRAWVEGSSEALSSHALRRPMTKMFRMFRQGVDETQLNTSPRLDNATFSNTDRSEILYQSSLDFVSLHNIGHVRLEWVDTITGHLQFNHQMRSVSLFRFPTMCIANIVGRNGPLVIKQYVNLAPGL
ncbi:hypothetical protein N7485_009965 [Penicillium canescens]|nr:hypothetical protein N7485_009965 [Penicillium canescens]